ncbi:MAG: SBBP repeat-containing protein [Bacteroidetes bacterium]|nr:SBBP repeat-containing protein [Bacteroidota bacterium]
MKMPSTLLLICCLALYSSKAQTYQWAKSIGATDEDMSKSIAVDGSGNVYTTGFFTGTVDFDPGPGTNNLTCVGDKDIFISKLDAMGHFLWAKSMGGIDIDWGYSIALDGAGNVYTTGFFEGSADFDPGVGTNILSTTGEGDFDIYISKLDAAGNFIWAKSMGASSYDEGRSIAVDGAGNVYTTGYFQGSVDFDPGVGTNYLTGAGSLDIFISKLDAAGNFVWAKSMGGVASDWGVSIVVDRAGNIYTTGIFSGSGDFDPGPGTSNLTSAGNMDIFISN